MCSKRKYAVSKRFTNSGPFSHSIERCPCFAIFAAARKPYKAVENWKFGELFASIFHRDWMWFEINFCIRLKLRRCRLGWYVQVNMKVLLAKDSSLEKVHESLESGRFLPYIYGIRYIRRTVYSTTIPYKPYFRMYNLHIENYKLAFQIKLPEKLI